VKKLAVIGTGISGMGAAYLLRDRFAITLCDKNDYVGGHTCTVTVCEDGRDLPVDTGFMVYNEVTYPNLTRLFHELDVATKPTSMSFSVQHRPSGIEYNGGSLNLLFGQRANLWNPRFWRMLLQINRFNDEAVAVLDDPNSEGLTLAEFAAQRGYGRDFLDLYLVPMAGAVWSTPPERMLQFPACTLIRFWHNHGFLGLHTQHPWRTVVDGTRSYVSKLIAKLQASVRLERAAVRVDRSAVQGMARITFADGSVEDFDKVILACHGDQALALLADPSDLETRLLSCFKYQSNDVTLHTDASVMPRTRRCWASWNYRMERAADGSLAPTTHYWMNSLQGVSDKQQYFVSLNAQEFIAPGKILRRIQSEHPLFDVAAVAAQRELPDLNRLSPDQTTHYCGAWFKYGFHEDGFTSGLECARSVAGEDLWR